MSEKKIFNFDIVGRSQVYEKFSNTTTMRITFTTLEKLTSLKG